MPVAVKQSTSNLEAELASLLSNKAVSTGSKSLAKVFEELAKGNGHVVVTTKGRAGQTSWTVVKLSNGELGYPEAVRKEIERVKQELAKPQSK